ncbi:MAG: bifunctional 5,10-methylenetetrahydrofolate dehydrogenase/5,10-methenyltetrahydrofolate cyclohydrolase [bacterium]
MILDGKKLAEEIRRDVKVEIERLGISPGLAVVLAGDDPASHLYVSLKEKAATEVGITFHKVLFPDTVTKQGLINKIGELNNDPTIHGIIVQLPLPRPEFEDEVIAALNPKKDVDGFHQTNLEALEEGRPLILPVLLKVTIRLLKEAGLNNLRNKIAVLIANNPLFFRPFKAYLEQSGCRVFGVVAGGVLHRRLVQPADILITAVGQPKLISAGLVKPGAVVIDIGMSRVNDKTVGDVDFELVKEKAGAITPVPGGVGPMTVATLLENTLETAKNQLAKGTYNV